MITIEVDHARACEAVFLANYIPEVHIWVGLLGISDSIARMVWATDGTSSQIVRCSLAHVRPLFNGFNTATEQDIDGDLRLVVDEILALGDGILNIDVSGS